MGDLDFTPLTGGCTCSNVRYKLTASPLIIHCCHCHWCQRETGSAFVLNAFIESKHCELTDINSETIPPISTHTPSESGFGQSIVRCAKCQVAVWSHYGFGPIISFVRIGTLDPESKTRLWSKVKEKEWDMINIYTESKVPWITLPEDVRSFTEYYDTKSVWSKESWERREVYMPAILEQRKKAAEIKAAEIKAEDGCQTRE
jgi:hypothetical protein